MVSFAIYNRIQQMLCHQLRGIDWIMEWEGVLILLGRGI